MIKVLDFDNVPESSQWELPTNNAGPIVGRAVVLPTDETGWDHVVRKLEDLPAPVADVITLTDGSWLFAASFSLGPNRIEIPPSFVGMLAGHTYGTTLYGNTAPGVPMIDCLSGAVSFVSLGIIAGGGIGIRMSNTGDDGPIIIGCTFTGETCVELVSGRARAVGCQTRGFDSAYKASGGTLSLTSCKMLAGNIAIELAGGSVIASDTIAISVGWCVKVTVPNTGALLHLATCELGFASTCIQGGIGLDSFTCIGTEFHFAGFGIDWQAAELPANGSAILGCMFNGLTPIANFTAASPGMTMRACYNAGVAMSETPLVP